MDYDVDPYIDFANGGNDITNYINRVVDAGDFRSRILFGESQSSYERISFTPKIKFQFNIWPPRIPYIYKSSKPLTEEQKKAIELFNKANTNRK